MAGVVEAAVAGAETDLRQARAGPDPHRKGARRDFGVERAVVARLDRIEAARPVGDDAGEDVDAPRRTLRVGGGSHVLRQRKAVVEFHHRHGAGLEDHAGREIEFVGRLRPDAVHHAAVLPGQEARPHPPGAAAEAQVEARRLQHRRGAVGRQRGADRAGVAQGLDLVGGEETRREARG